MDCGTNWPSPNIATQVFFLTDSGLFGGESSLSGSVSSPQDTGLTAGEYFRSPMGRNFPVSRGRRPRSLVFDSTVLDEAKDIVGAPKLSVQFSSDQPSALLHVRLCDVLPDGRSALITHGFLNLAHHASHESLSRLSRARSMKPW